MLHHLPLDLQQIGNDKRCSLIGVRQGQERWAFLTGLLEYLGVYVVPVLSHLEKPPCIRDGLYEGVKIGLGCMTSTDECPSLL